MNRLFITGDCHAAYTKLGYKRFPEGRDLTKDDYVVICGDFGLWDESAEMDYWLNWLEAKPFTTLWVDGNHENFDLIKQFSVEEWNGGKVQFIRPSVIHLMRGQIFTIAGKTFFTFGGARSHDIKDGILERDDPFLKAKEHNLRRLGALYRVNHVSWWKEEMPTDEERAEGWQNLEEAAWQVDYIITHCCAGTTLNERSGGFYEGDEQTEFFAKIKEKCAFKHWFFGHYHVDEDWNEKETCLYEQIVELTEAGYTNACVSSTFKCSEHVRFKVAGKNGMEERTGYIVHIDARGGGIYLGEQPTANIRADDWTYHKNVPFEDIRKIEE